jgi:catechol 2,3-dioxygenase-like lactoylglutathione lyase family enzyme
MGSRSLALDPTGHPHIAYGGDALYYTWYDGSAWQLTTVDDSPGAGDFTSLALDGAGYPHISYQDGYHFDLKYAYQDAAGWHVFTVDSAGDVGEYTALALDSAGYPHISYFNETNGDLKYAYQDTTGWHVATLDSSGASGAYSSLVLDDAGYAHISYKGAASLNDLRYIYEDAAGWHSEVADTGDFYHTSLVLDKSGYPHISYLTFAGLKYAYRDAAGWHSEAVDSTAGLGWGTSLGLDEGGYPHITYQDYWNGDMKYAYQDGAGWHVEVVDSSEYTGLYTSLALDVLDRPHVSYYERTNGRLRYAYRDTLGWHLATVDSGRWVGTYTSLAVDGARYAHISYWDERDFVLKYAYEDAAGWHISVLDNTWYSGQGASLVVDSAGYTHLSYRAGATLKYAYEDDTGWHFTLLEGNCGSFTSLALDAAGYAHISYYDLAARLKYTYQDAAGWHITIVDGAGSVGEYNSLGLDGSGYPHMSYYDRTNGDLKYAYQDAGGWYTTTVDSGGDVGEYSSLAVDGAGYPHISYYDSTNGDLKHAYQDAAGWHIEFVDSAGNVGRFTSLVLDAAGYAHIGYSQWNSYYLGCDGVKYAYQDAAGWHIAFVDYDDGYVGWYLAMTLDWSGAAHISYYDQSCGDLKYARQCLPASAAVVAGPAGLPVGQTALYSATLVPINASHALFTWDNGAVGPAAAYSWTLPGTYTVTVSATNGCSAVGGSLAVTVCQPVAAVTPQGPTWLLAGATALYSATYTPPTATQPVTLTWDNGTTGPQAAYSWTQPGDYTVTVTAASWCGAVSETLPIHVCQPVTEAAVAGPRWLPLGQAGLYSATYAPPTATLPVTWTWNNGTIGPSAAYSWTVVGAYLVAVTGTNECGQAAGTLWVTACQPLREVTIAGPTRLLADTSYPFTATAAPPTATLPVTFTWDNGSTGPYAAYSWAASGQYTLAVTAGSPCGATAVATATVAVCAGAQDVSFSWTPLTPTVDQWVSFHGHAAGESPLTYTWALGDGGHASGANVSHRYVAGGNYGVVLTATNCAGLGVATVSHTLAVLPGPCQSATILSVTASIYGCAATLGAELRGDAPFTYLWDLGAFGAYTEAAPQVSFRSSGTYSGTLRVWNCGQPVPAVRSFAVAVACSRTYFLYLPLVRREHP